MDREEFMKAARDYWDEVTPATARAKARAWRKAKEALISDNTLREWDQQAAREVMPSIFWSKS